MIDATLAWIALAEVASQGTTVWLGLAEKLGGPLALLQADDKTLSSFGLLPRAISRLRRVGNLVGAQASLKRAQDLGLGICTFSGTDFPARLVNIPDPPMVLYYKGRAPNLCEPVVAIVGSREATTYGLAVATALAAELAARGICVASGLARGIDQAAHEGALKRGLSLAVLAGGLDSIYPARNWSLSRRISADGALVSERPPGVRPQRYDFPRRNRILTGLAKVLVVVEARRASGSWTSAMHAANQGHTVLAVPGPINSPTSAGTNALIAQGATPMLEIADILDRLDDKSLLKATQPTEKKGGIGSQESLVLAAIEGRGSTVDELIETVSLDGAVIMALLTSLELAGLAIRTPEGKFIAVGPCL